MFLRILAGFLLLLALVWVVLYVSGAAAVRRETRQPWPYGLGSLKQSAEFHPYSPSKESEQLATLVEPFNDMDVETTEAYVAAQIAKSDDSINPSWPGNEAKIADLVRFVVANGGRLSWSTYRFSNVTTLLAAAALDRARDGDAATAWDDVHAIWILAGALAPTSGWRSQQQVLIAVRNAAAIARKLPAPAPPWAAEIAAFDPRRQTAVILQDVAKLHVRGRRRRGIEVIFQPFLDYSDASQMRRTRLAAEGMAASNPCRTDATAVDAVRASRIEAELEATMKVLALKTERARLGRWPAAMPDGGASRCAGNHWIYEVKSDGASMTLRMSSEAAPDAKTAPALRFSY